MDSQKETITAKFVAYLISLKNDRGAMAELRRGFSLALEHRTWKYLVPWFDIRNTRLRTIAQTVAAGFASNPLNADTGNMGGVMRTIATADSRGRDGLKTYESRFHRILTCMTAQEACQLLVGPLKTCGAKGIPINYKGLLDDLQRWNRYVKIQWAAEYWRDLSGEEQHDVSD